MKMEDKLTFRNHKNETYEMTRQEFRNAAKGLQHKDHRPVLHETAIEKATPKERLFQLTEINNVPV